MKYSYRQLVKTAAPMMPEKFDPNRVGGISAGGSLGVPKGPVQAQPVPTPAPTPAQTPAQGPQWNGTDDEFAQEAKRRGYILDPNYIPPAVKDWMDSDQGKGWLKNNGWAHTDPAKEDGNGFIQPPSREELRKYLDSNSYWQRGEIGPAMPKRVPGSAAPHSFKNDLMQGLKTWAKAASPELNYGLSKLRGAAGLY